MAAKYTCTLTLEDVKQGMLGPYMIMHCGKCNETDEQAIESDAWEYECPFCGENAWGSAEEWLLRGYVKEGVGLEFDV